ncbi:DUF302 domain-containing protein [Enterococcus faecium]|uniref:DUF302 domain-containing protein n=1 Tax=Enterococcus faecium TaxID=1352 RepID=UPI00207438AD|nr:DUF302 domain-containing protein [Enterococcus faecium]MCM6906502.1 DUF302 domain-containing protein [Enterococcus faecium]MCM6925570.1 DUF302 domain-containing protein [Enterococcus faecium]
MCNPKQAKEVLEKRIEVGYFLPCKVVVYEKEADVYIGLLKQTVLIYSILCQKEELDEQSNHTSVFRL